MGHGEAQGLQIHGGRTRAVCGAAGGDGERRQAAAAAGVDSSTVYHHRLCDPGLAHAWRMALLTGYDRIELALIRRALGRRDEERASDDEDGAAGGAAGAGELDVELALKLLNRHKPVMTQAMTAAMATTFRASRDGAEATLLVNLGAYAKREGLHAPWDAAEGSTDAPVLLLDAAATA